MPAFSRLSLVLCLSGLVCAAQDPSFELEKVGVSAQNPEPPVSSALALPPSARTTTDVITREDIAAIKPQDIFDLIGFATGGVTSSMGTKTPDTYSVRGGDGNSLGIILDGCYIPYAQATRFLAQFPLDTIESVRVIRNSSSLTLGPLLDVGSGGVSPNQGYILITTRKGTHRETGFAVESGTYATTEGQIFHGDRKGAFSYRVTGTLKRTEGPTGWNMGQEGNSILASGGYDGGSLQLGASLYVQHGQQDWQHSFTNNQNKNYRSYDPVRSFMLSFTGSKQWRPGQTTAFAYSHSFLGDTEVLGTATTANVPSTVTSTTFTRQSDITDNAHLWHTLELGKHTLKGGLQGTWWDEPSGFASWDGTPRKITVLGAYLQDTQRIGQGLSLDYGVRADRQHYIESMRTYPQSPATYVPVDARVTQWAATVGAAWRLNGRHILTGQAGYSHTPTDPGLLAVGSNSKSPLLSTERRMKYEAGIEAHYHRAFNPKLTAFYYRIEDYTFSITKGSNSGIQTYDTADTHRHGFELSSTGELGLGFSYNLKYAHVQVPDVTGDRGIVLPAKATPADTGALTVSFRQGPVQVNGSVKRVGPYENNYFTASGSAAQYFVAVGDITRYDANASLSFHYLALQGRVTAFGQNLSDQHYETINGFANQGRTYGLRLEGQF
nr:TonB-dependent receptor plug domain-containing protein [uncultured Holophaga sp.]